MQRGDSDRYQSPDQSLPSLAVASSPDDRHLGLPYCKLQPMSALVRIPDETKAKLDRMALETQQTRAALIVDALCALEERWFWKAFHETYENIAQDPRKFDALRVEREHEVGALKDGLE